MEQPEPMNPVPHDPHVAAVIDEVRTMMERVAPGCLFGIWRSEAGIVRVVYRPFDPYPFDGPKGAAQQGIILGLSSDQVMGLCREVEPHVSPAAIADEMVYLEMGEPLGSLWDQTWVEAGVLWFRGDLPEWRSYS